MKVNMGKASQSNPCFYQSALAGSDYILLLSMCGTEGVRGREKGEVMAT